MKALCNAALAGFNTLLDEQKKLVVATRFSLSFFSDDVSVIHDGVPIAGISPMKPASYRPEGNTALLDGIGSMIEGVAQRVDPSPYPSRVLIAILTDGMENSSVRFSKEKIFELISFRRSACGWQFLFMGRGSQTIQTGLSFRYPAHQHRPVRSGPGRCSQSDAGALGCTQSFSARAPKRRAVAERRGKVSTRANRNVAGALDDIRKTELRQAKRARERTGITDPAFLYDKCPGEIDPAFETAMQRLWDICSIDKAGLVPEGFG